MRKFKNELEKQRPLGSASKQGIEPAPNNPSSNSHHHMRQFPPGTHQEQFLQNPEKPLKAQTDQEVSNTTGQRLQDNPVFSWIPKHLKGPNSQSTSKSSERLECPVPLFPMLEKLRPGSQISISFPTTALSGTAMPWRGSGSAGA